LVLVLAIRAVDLKRYVQDGRGEGETAELYEEE